MTVLIAQCVALAAEPGWFADTSEWLSSWGIGLLIIVVSVGAIVYETWRLIRAVWRRTRGGR